MTTPFSDLTPSQMGSLVYRGLSVGLLVLVTVASNGVWAKVSETSNQITRQSEDIALIKWELPTIKKTAEVDKSEVLRQVENIEKRMQAIREESSFDRTELAKIRTDVALLKQKLQIP